MDDFVVAGPSDIRHNSSPVSVVILFSYLRLVCCCVRVKLLKDGDRD